MRSDTANWRSSLPKAHARLTGRKVARETRLPLIDFHAEILKRRPADWNGAHPSSPQKYQGDYSEEALRSYGCSLRNYLTLLRYAEVIAALQAPPMPGREPNPPNGTAEYSNE